VIIKAEVVERVLLGTAEVCACAVSSRAQGRGAARRGAARTSWLSVVAAGTRVAMVLKRFVIGTSRRVRAKQTALIGR
jgi:hypothetical protein